MAANTAARGQPAREKVLVNSATIASSGKYAGKGRIGNLGKYASKKKGAC